MAADSSELKEFTIDELAQRANMTVRNVRAYAGRGLIDAPRLEGRTGYYSTQHLQRLRLIRELLDRGYTLAAVERAMLASPATAAGHTLDLLDVLSGSAGDERPEVMSRDALAALAGVHRDNALIDSLADLGLLEWIDDGENVRLLRPTIVRSGAAAVALGLSPESVISMFPEVSEGLRQVAESFVRHVAAQIVDPFIAQGMPEDQWAPIMNVIEALLPVASQVTLAVFRDQLAHAIEREISDQISGIAN